MKFAISHEHKDYFQKNQKVECELLSIQQVAEINRAIDEMMQGKTAEEAFLEGRDLWRKHPVIKKIVCQSNFAEVVSELVNFKPIKIAYDQLIEFPTSKHSMPFSNAQLEDLFHHENYLEAISSVQNMLGGLVICLSNADEDPSQDHSGTVFSTIPGNGVFFSNLSLIPFSELLNRPHQRFLMITYCKPSAVYILQKRDPHTHFLKNLGYDFGDPLSIKTHPILFR